MNRVAAIIISIREAEASAVGCPLKVVNKHPFVQRVVG
jgi:hypothetical protein